MKPILGSVALLGLLGATPALAQSDPGRDAFVRWARQAATPVKSLALDAPMADLAPLRAIVGNATLVALSEGVHAGAEPLEFRNRVFRYLVENLGFTAIAIESGLTEGRTVHDYVRTGQGDLARVLDDGLTWTFDNLPQNADLIRWIRDYNADPKHTRKLNFYGFDVPGSPGNPFANRKMRTALDDALVYLARVDAEAARHYHQRLDSLLPFLHLDPRSMDTVQYAKLGPTERDRLTAAIGDLIATVERREARYVAASNRTDYQWAYRNLLGARAVDLWLRQMPLGWDPSKGMSFFGESTDIRDRMQADNVGWIVDQEGPGGKVLIFASRYHISAAPVKTTFSGPTGNAVAGTYLRPRFGNRLVTFGNLIGKGSFGCTGFEGPVDPNAPTSIDAIAGEVGPPLYLLDLRRAPPAVQRWLDREHEMGGGPGKFSLQLKQAFDVYFYEATVRPACPK